MGAYQRLIHDAAVVMAHTLLDRVKPCLSEEEWLDTWMEFYTICKAGLEAFELQQARMQNRLRPGKN